MLTFSFGAKSARAPSEAEVERGTEILTRNFIKLKKDFAISSYSFWNKLRA